MASIKPSVPKGTRDFSPAEMVKRNYIFDTIKSVFRKYGYQQIETPTMENSDTLMGKYGEEGDRLIFKVLESGEFSSGIAEELIGQYQNTSIENEVKEVFIKLAEEFSIQVANLDDITTSKKDSEIKEDLHWLLKSNSFLSEISSPPQYFYSIKHAFVKYLFDKGDADKFKPFKNRFRYYLSIRNINERSNEILKGFKYLIKTNSTLERLINFETLIKKSLVPSKLSRTISKKALRYDLTVPFARYVVQHQNEITFPFKRFQVQPVWRADRPQRGRYREFYQCDADVVGSDSLLNEAEFIMIYDEALTKLGLKDFSIKINNRKILSGIAQVIDKSDNIIDLTVAIDKLDKIGLDGVIKELLEKGFTDADIDKLKPVILLEGNNTEKLASLRGALAQSEIGLKGCDEIETVFGYIERCPLQTAKLELDITLARGLNYYTGAIFEVKTNEVNMGSIGGGGRYDDLTGMFGLKGLTGAGISFGADRIYDVLEELNLFPAGSNQTTQVLICNFDKEGELYSLPLLQRLRRSNVNTELYPAGAKIKKQMEYANNKHIPYVVVIGGDEMQTGLLTFKDMASGVQEKLTADEIAAKLNRD
ncbi:histidine--tRNA ligase [Mucilaginibacter sp. Mucisp84]|uniref:histidine--tRNA ligase n=1 Tax=Mucilaginibacter sp. Mucisp84 TaxID=3243058 RepID=UPI0039A6B941